MPENSSSSVRVPAQVDERDERPASARLNLLPVLIGAFVVAGAFIATYGFSGQELMEASSTVFLVSMGGLVVAVVVERLRKR